MKRTTKTAVESLASDAERAAFKFAVTPKDRDEDAALQRLMLAIVEDGKQHPSKPDALDVAFVTGVGVGFFDCSALRDAEIASLKAQIFELQERAAGKDGAP